MWRIAGIWATPSTRCYRITRASPASGNGCGSTSSGASLEQLVDLCQDTGLVWGREFYVDAPKVEANAGIPSLIPRFSDDTATHVTTLFAAERDADDTKAPAPAETLPTRLVHLPTEPNFKSEPPAGDLPWRLLEERRLNPRRPAKRGYRRTGNFRVSPTAPDASPMWDWGAIRLGDHDDDVVGGGKRRIILAALGTPADVMANQAMRDLLWRVCFRRKIWHHHVTGDAKYGSPENIVALEDAGIRAYVPLTDFAPRTDDSGQDDFIVDPERDEYRCPRGHPLRRYSTKRTEGVVADHGEAAVCNDCPVKAKGTASDHGRMIPRSLYADSLERVRGSHMTEVSKQAIRLCHVWVEPLFAEAKAWHG